MVKNISKGLKFSISVKKGANLEYLKGFYGIRHNYTITEYKFCIDMTIEMTVWTLSDYERVRDSLGSDLLQIVISPLDKID